ncbi:hypothetical protein A2U01_0089826, partial [Trifolium medium]|nr:hypothetical protein [Trifolium medium]
MTTCVVFAVLSPYHPSRWSHRPPPTNIVFVVISLCLSHQQPSLYDQIRITTYDTSGGEGRGEFFG